MQEPQPGADGKALQSSLLAASPIFGGPWWGISGPPFLAGVDGDTAH